MADRRVPDDGERPKKDDRASFAESKRLEKSSSIFSLLPPPISPQADRQTFRTAFVHSAAILFVLVCLACALLAYRVLEPFLRSILWSILAGAFLFPFKSHLTSTARFYLGQLDTDSHLLFYGLAILLPLRTIDRTIESIGPLCLRKWKPLLIILIFLPAIELLQTGVIYRWITTVSDDVRLTVVSIVQVFDSPWVTTLVIAYVIAVLTMYESSPWMTSLLNLFAIPVWLVFLMYLSQFLPVTCRLIAIALVIALIVVGFAVDVRKHIKQSFAQSDPIRSTSQRRSVKSRANSSALSTPYFTFVLWSLVAIKVYQFYWYLIPIPFLVIIYKIIKYSVIYTWFYLIKQARVQAFIGQVRDFLRVRRDVLTPSPLHGLVRLLIKGDKKFNHGLQASIDYLVSAFMIVTLLVSVLLAAILLFIQIRHEGIHMIKLTSNLVNETLVLQPSFQHMLPDKEHMSDLMDTAVNNFYLVGRTWIAKQVNTFGHDSPSNTKLEEEVLQLWDRLYTYMTNASMLLIADDNRSSIMYTPVNRSLFIPNLWGHMQNNFDFHFNDFYGFIHDNLGLLRTVLDSIWSNATLLLTLLSSIVSLLFTGGFALLNFLVSFIVFVTLLFYLLSHSDQSIYRPTDWLNNLLAVGGKGLGKAVNDAVTSVFVASLKIAAFYGLYTYELHTIVGSNLVFLPAVIASVCAVTLKSYWAALPGCLDLWLVQQRPLAALLLLLGQIGPVYVVDTAIYSEVKGGGHQYLTALAIAGGVYYRGIEGALIGPIVLCCLLVGIKLYKETMTTTLQADGEQALPSANIGRKSFHRSRSLQTVTTESNDSSAIE